MDIITKIIADKKLGRLISVKPLEKNSKRNYLVKTNNGKFVFSFYINGPRYRTLEELKAQQELNSHLLKKKLPVAKVVCVGRNKEKKINFIIKEYLQGQAKFNPTTNEFIVFAQTFGQFHKLVKNYQTKNKFIHRWDLKSTLQYSKELQKKFVDDEFLPKMTLELKNLIFTNKLPHGTIHEDLGRRHVLWENNKITGFIDFERSYYAPLILDLGQTIRGWCFSSDWKKWDNKKLKIFLKNYCLRHLLTKLEKNNLYPAIKFAVLERALSFYSKYLHHRDKSAQKYAEHSLNYLLPSLEKNKNKINSIINAA